MNIHRNWCRFVLGGLVIVGFFMSIVFSKRSEILLAETINDSSSEEIKNTIAGSSELLPTTSSESSTVDSSTGNVPEESPEQEATSTKESITEAIPEISTETSETGHQESAASSEELPVPAPLPVEKVEEHFQFSVVKNQTTEEFIEMIGADAQRIAWQEELYASVMIAQAILETGSGNSQLARVPYYNLFGIKGSYQGKQVTFDTQEDKGNGQLYTISSAFRQYPSYKESLADYARLLKQGLSGNRAYYQGTWKSHARSYQEATKYLTGRYATDTSYDKKLNALIEAYGLTNYDQEPGHNQLVKPEENKEMNDMEEKLPLPVETRNSHSENEVPTRKSLQKQELRKAPSITQIPAKQIKANQTVK